MHEEKTMVWAMNVLYGACVFFKNNGKQRNQLSLELTILVYFGSCHFGIIRLALSSSAFWVAGVKSHCELIIQQHHQLGNFLWMLSNIWHAQWFSTLSLVSIGVISNPAYLAFVRGLIKNGMGEEFIKHSETRNICFSWAGQWSVSLAIISISSHLFSSHKRAWLRKLYLKCLNGWFLKPGLQLQVLRHLQGTISKPSHKSQRLAVYHYDWSLKTGSMQLIPETWKQVYI